jgi:hypothetical protein
VPAVWIFVDLTQADETPALPNTTAARIFDASFQNSRSDKLVYSSHFCHVEILRKTLCSSCATITTPEDNFF